MFTVRYGLGLYTKFRSILLYKALLIFYIPVITGTKIFTPVRLHNKSSATDDVMRVNGSDALSMQETAELCTCHVRQTDRRTHSDFIKLYSLCLISLRTSAVQLRHVTDRLSHNRLEV